MKPAYGVTPAPHIRDAGTVPGIFWMMSAALIPTGLVFLVFFRSYAIRASLVAIGTALAVEAAAQWMTKKRNRLYDGTAVLTGFLLAMMVPADLPVWKIALGAGAAVLFGKELFGGLGTCFLNPALVGHAVLQLSFPDQMRMIAPGILSPSLSPLVNVLAVAALTAGGLFLIWRKIVYWQIPLIYTGLLGVLFLISPWQGTPFSLPWLLFSAFFLITDPLTTPVRRQALRLNAAAAAGLTWILHAISGVPVPGVFAVLLTNLLTPWVDQWMLPRGPGKSKAVRGEPKK